MRLATFQDNPVIPHCVIFKYYLIRLPMVGLGRLGLYIHEPGTGLSDLMIFTCTDMPA